MEMKYWKKLKKILATMFLDCGGLNNDNEHTKVAAAVHCDELFISSVVKTNKANSGLTFYGEDDILQDNPIIAAHLAAQNYFSFRPTIYL